MKFAIAKYLKSLIFFADIPDTASETFLERWGSLYGIKRQVATRHVTEETDEDLRKRIIAYLKVKKDAFLETENGD